MGLKDAKEGKLLYHLTELKNLESIIDFGLVPRKILRENTVTFGDVADPEIIRKRESLGLDGYIPFHFHPYSCLLYTSVANTGRKSKNAISSVFLDFLPVLATKSPFFQATFA